jgi:hypothetical protein
MTPATVADIAVLYAPSLCDVWELERWLAATERTAIIAVPAVAELGTAQTFASYFRGRLLPGRAWDQHDWPTLAAALAAFAEPFALAVAVAGRRN